MSSRNLLLEQIHNKQMTLFRPSTNKKKINTNKLLIIKEEEKKAKLN